LPDLFREGQGVIVNGKMENGTLKAITLFAKHDERYIPRELYKAAIDQNICKNN
jgi:cytochrome c-type biogenesis protein CcmE